MRSLRLVRTSESVDRQRDVVGEGVAAGRQRHVPVHVVLRAVDDRLEVEVAAGAAEGVGAGGGPGAGGDDGLGDALDRQLAADARRCRPRRARRRSRTNGPRGGWRRRRTPRDRTWARNCSGVRIEIDSTLPAPSSCRRPASARPRRACRGRARRPGTGRRSRSSSGPDRRRRCRRTAGGGGGHGDVLQRLVLTRKRNRFRLRSDTVAQPISDATTRKPDRFSCRPFRPVPWPARSTRSGPRHRR